MSASSWNVSQRSYSYDRWGNRTSMTDSSSGASQSVSLQLSGGVPTNRISSVTNNGIISSYLYDASGNVTNDGAHSYVYDGEGRIASVDGGAATYSYDIANRRVKKIVVNGGSTLATSYIWEGTQVIAEYSNASTGSGGTSYYLADRLSTRMTTDANGAFKGTQDHLPFGEDAGTNGTSEKHRFTSYERDAESGSDYALNRQHQYGSGRFMQPDPLFGNGAVPQSHNRYTYARNDAVDFSDPFGLTVCLLDGFEISWIGQCPLFNPGQPTYRVLVCMGQPIHRG